MKKWIPIIATVLLTVAADDSNFAKRALVLHPALGIALAGVYGVAQGLLKSPIGKEDEKK